MQIEYICTKCGKKVRNIVAQDDNKEEILKVVRNYAITGGK
jgi:DNA-directed RNA polymerase subunit RPC12/RpoP